ncbi:MAG: hypothetical protein U0694_06505 [Anaerolineae bacterium]
MQEVKANSPASGKALADFDTPLALEVCVDRLQSRHGKFFDFTINVILDMVDVDSYRYQMRVRRGYRYPFDLTVTGWLIRQNEFTTQVLIYRKYQQDAVTTRSVAGFLLCFGLFLTLGGQNILILLLPVLFIASLLYNNYYNTRQVVQMIEGALSAV